MKIQRRCTCCYKLAPPAYSSAKFPSLGLRDCVNTAQACRGTFAATDAACSGGQKNTLTGHYQVVVALAHLAPHPPIQRCQRVPGDPRTWEPRRASRFRRWATPSQAPVPTPWEIAPPLEEAPENNLRPRFRASGPGQSLPWTTLPDLASRARNEVRVLEPQTRT